MFVYLVLNILDKHLNTETSLLFYFWSVTAEERHHSDLTFASQGALSAYTGLCKPHGHRIHWHLTQSTKSSLNTVCFIFKCTFTFLQLSSISSFWGNAVVDHKINALHISCTTVRILEIETGCHLCLRLSPLCLHCRHCDGKSWIGSVLPINHFR